MPSAVCSAACAEYINIHPIKIDNHTCAVLAMLAKTGRARELLHQPLRDPKTSEGGGSPLQSLLLLLLWHTRPGTEERFKYWGNAS